MADKHQQGSIIVYILIAIFLTGMLVASMTQGAKKSASSTQINAMMLYLQNDIQTIQSNITECITTYSQGVDINADGNIDASDNPNQPFPLYHTLTYGAAGDAITAIKCPGAPAAQQTIFNDRISGSLKLLADTSNYTTTYFTNATDGVYIRITRAVSDPLWTEAISRLTTKYSQCSSIVENSSPDPTGFNCSAGCFYYWILRQSSGSSLFPVCP